LLVGARADATLVRRGAGEARVEARFELGDPERCALTSIEGMAGFDGDLDEVVVTRVVPADGRSRAYVNGRPVPVGLLAEIGRHLVDLHGQHSHQALLAPATQRAALDRFAGSAAAEALAEYRAARSRVTALTAELDGLGGDTRERAREVDLLRFQADEIDAAAIDGSDEDERLQSEADLLADAASHREAAAAAHAALEGPVLEGLGDAVARLDGRPGFGDAASRLAVLQQEAAELGREIRLVAEGITDDPVRLEEVGARRRLLRDLQRKYGDTLAEVLAYREEVGERLDHLLGAEDRARVLAAERDAARDAARAAAARLSKIRSAAAGRLGAAITSVVREMAMPAAELVVEIRPVPGVEGDALPEDGFDEVTFLLAANPGEGFKPLTRVASGGELARTMLAARVVLTEAPPTLVFDEVDAGIGGQAAVAVGRKLALVAESHQVLCVTHLAQVAAPADSHVVVEKREVSGRTVAEVRTVEGTERVGELSRMLGGTGTARARDHAEELLGEAARGRRS
ncbi:MAG TPA: DNA repair protein RecN, partial [Acidimicrobiia bacterium]|nr:DNA repair protein RecN [Acidimicrobiia bacterium]